ncbi:DNA cytosine methyltransferase [Streptomyces microflavus]|uniref:DNA cytosine methyltransferase n=1 Tax=Streptomyces microflavus TaxID=1919 RepID=UPI0037F92D26
MSGLRIGSVCSGYRGLDLAVEAVFGGRTVWVADNDPGASRILAHHLPQVPNLGDITTVDWHQAEPVDIYCGGYPCQPFSTAGHRKGTQDARHIWPHIAHSLRVLRPRLAVFENVAGHLSLGFDTVLGDLARIGFDADWCTLRASDIGAAHQRNRLFLLAWPADTSGQGLARRWAEGTAPHRRRLASADTLDLGSHRGGARGAGRDESAARRLAAAHTAGVGEREPADQTHPLTGGGDARSVSGGRGLRTAPGAPAWGRYGPAIERWEAVIGRPAPWPVDDLGRLNPPLVEWLMGLPVGWVTDVPGLSRTAQLKALGNGVVPQQAGAALRHLAARQEPEAQLGRAA